MKYWLLISLVFHLVAAYFNAGYYHYDEHFQILEFANYKLGHVPAASLAWEFHEKIRPWFQPALAYVLIRALVQIGLVDPFRQVMVFRLCHSLLAWMAGVTLLWVARRWVSRRAWTCAVWCTAFLWFLPFLHARPSSESLAGSLFFLGMACVVGILHRAEERRQSPSGMLLMLSAWLFGLAFLARFQIAFALLFFVLWFVIFHGRRWGGGKTTAHIVMLGGGMALAIPLGMVLDKWGYGAWVCSPWNYYVANIIEHKAVQWGVAPWWYYLKQIGLSPTPILGIPLLLSIACTLLFRSNNPVVLSTFGFLLGHSLVGHKEVRFMFPMAGAIPIVMALAYDLLATKVPFIGHWLDSSPWRAWIIHPIIWINCILLLGLSLLPANSNAALLKFLYHSPQIHEVTTTSKLNFPGGLEPRFYFKPGFVVHRQPSPEAFLHRASTSAAALYFVFWRTEQAAACKQRRGLERLSSDIRLPEPSRHCIFHPGHKSFQNTNNARLFLLCSQLDFIHVRSITESPDCMKTQCFGRLPYEWKRWEHRRDAPGQGGEPAYGVARRRQPIVSEWATWAEVISSQIGSGDTPGVCPEYV